MGGIIKHSLTSLWAFKGSSLSSGSCIFKEIVSKKKKSISVSSFHSHSYFCSDRRAIANTLCLPPLKYPDPGPRKMNASCGSGGVTQVEPLSSFFICKLTLLSHLVFCFYSTAGSGVTYTCEMSMLSLRLSLSGTQELNLLCVGTYDIRCLIMLMMRVSDFKRKLQK